MKGKIGLVVGLGVGYVLGTRAGRERYEQIKTQWLKVWHLDPVQEQVTKVKGYVGDKAAAVPGAVWNGLVKVAKAAGNADTPGKKLDSAIATGRKVADDLEDAVEDAVDEAKKNAAAAKKTSTGSTSKAKPAAKKPSTNGK
ncbi:hypothetical protein ACSS7Z_02115 [Microbacterium sp. A82]|uniref:hypothetical protein n=1 Tax=unclassified Microbacterium TaxID=2609290 RepID=UPI003F35DFAE